MQQEHTKKKISIIIIIFFVLAALSASVLYFRKPHLKITAEIRGQKESYLVGDTVVLAVKFTNYSLSSFEHRFSTKLSVEGVEQKPHHSYLFDAPAFGGGSGGLFVEITPFDSEIFVMNINLVNNKSWELYAGEQYNYDLLVRPGNNRILFGEGDEQVSVDVYISPEDFYEEPIKCDQFTKPNRQDQCYSKLLEEGGERSEICEKYNTLHLKASCFAELAKQKKDISICNELIETFYKNSCIKNAT